MFTAYARFRVRYKRTANNGIVIIFSPKTYSTSTQHYRLAIAITFNNHRYNERVSGIERCNYFLR